MTSSPRLPAAFRLVALDTVTSTSDEAKRLARLGEDATPEGTLVWAAEQTAGRGRRGRSWHSPPGNLYCSLVLRPECQAGAAASLGFVAALAVYDAIGSVVEGALAAWLKWPNDVMMHGGKVAGVLLEAETGAGGAPDWVVVGVGVNIAHAPADADRPATCLAAEGNPQVTVVAMLEAFARHFLSWCGRWRDGGFAAIRRPWLDRAKGIGERIEVRLDGRTVRGVFADLDADGALVLRQGARTLRISAGDVFAVGGGG